MSCAIKGHVLYNYSASDDDEISLFKGECVFILETYDDGWWMVKKGEDLVGLAPSNYLRINDDVHTQIEDAELPKGWKSAIDKESNDIYYYNEWTGLVQWENPSLPLSHTNRLTQIECRIAKVPAGANKPQATQSTDPRKQTTAPSSSDYQSNSDLKRLQALRLQAEQKINDLRYAVSNHENVSAAKTSARLTSESLEEPPLSTNSTFLPMTSADTADKPRPRGTEESNSGHQQERHLPEVGGKSRHSSDIKKHRHDYHNGQEGAFRLPALDGHAQGQGNGLGQAPGESHSPATDNHNYHHRKKDKKSNHSHPPQCALHNEQDKNLGQGFHYPYCRSMIYSPLSAESVPPPPPSPTCKLELKHVFGYEGNPHRHGTTARGKNVIFVDDRRIMFPAAALVVVMDVLDERRQGFFCGHTEDVLCLAAHPDKAIAASGQLGKDGMILVWSIAATKGSRRAKSGSSSGDSKTSESPYSRVDSRSTHKAMIELKPVVGIRAVCGLNFNGGSGDLLVALGIDESHSAMIYNWKARTLIASTKIGHADVRQIAFNPYNHMMIREGVEGGIENGAHHLHLHSPSRVSDASDGSSVGGKKHSPHPHAHPSSQSFGCFTLVSYGGKHIKFWTLKPVLSNEPDPMEQMSSFKGRRLVNKGDRHMNYILQGGLGRFPDKGSNAAKLELTCMVMSDTAHCRLPSRSRVFTGTSTCCIYIWQQLAEEEGNEGEALYKNGYGQDRLQPSWLPQGRLLTVVMGAHDSPLVDLDYIKLPFLSGRDVEERIFSSSNDGVVNIWRMQSNPDSEPLDHVGALELSSKEYVRSISWNNPQSRDNKNLLALGTAENSILLLHYEEEDHDDADGPSIVTSLTPILRSHDGKVQRIATHPVLSSFFATISTDRTVRIWNCSSVIQQISFFKLTYATSTCLGFSPDGTNLAIGNEHGELCIYECDLLTQLVEGDVTVEAMGTAVDAHNWTLIYKRNITAKTGSAVTDISHPPLKQKRNRKYEVTELRYSACGRLLALGCKDNLIHILNVQHHYKHVAVCRGHTSYIRSIDFSVDGRFIQAADAARELLFWDTATGQQVTHSVEFRNIGWHTWSSIYGWPVQGVLNGDMGRKAADHADVEEDGNNPSHRMPAFSLDGEINCVARSPDGALLVAGGSHTVNKAIKLFNNPCLPHCSPSLHGGHTSPVLDVAFTSYRTGQDSAHVVTAGGNDCCVFVWNVVLKD